MLFGIVMLADFGARLFISRHRWRDLANPFTWADIAAIVSFLAPLAGEAAGFLRVLRTLRLLRSYQLLMRLRRDISYFRAQRGDHHRGRKLRGVPVCDDRHRLPDAARHQPGDHNYADALYFTVTALTTTGFGDITLPGTSGRLISVAIMIFGVTLFLGLVRARVAPAEGPLPVPQLRAAAPRPGCGALQGVRSAAEHSRTSSAPPRSSAPYNMR